MTAHAIDVRAIMQILFTFRSFLGFRKQESITLLLVCVDGFIPVTAKIRIFPHNAIENHNVVVRKNDRILSIVFGILNIIKKKMWNCNICFD